MRRPDPWLAAIADDPERFVELPEGSRRSVTDRYCIVVGPQRRWADVCSLRMPTSTRDVQRTFAEIGELVSGCTVVHWNVGSTATPDRLVEQLHELGLRDPDPPMDAVCAAMVQVERPPDIGRMDIRRVETLDEHRAGLEIMLAAATWTNSAAADEKSRAEQTYKDRRRRGGYEWLAWRGGEPVAYARAELTVAGLFLSGGATLPEARGLGCYRALVRARWDEAVRLGLRGLAVQAQYASSAPILRKLGFVDVGIVRTLQS